MNHFYIFDTEDFNNRYAYDGNDLGFTWSKNHTIFKLWAPMSDECCLILYADGYLGGPSKTHTMVYEKNGVWSVTIKGNLNSYYYNFSVSYDGVSYEISDPYAKGAGVNGRRCMVVDFESLNPTGWKEDAKRKRTGKEKAVIYEGHVRNLTINKNSGVINKGIFQGLGEKGTKNSYEMPSGLDYIESLGITHLHLLPVNDFATVDETAGFKDYNWGYDPQHYSVLEGSYSSNPYRGSVRIREFKELVQNIHNAGINVVLDVVYNHTYRGTDGDLYKVFPGFYYRTDSSGNLSNGSGCGNELATERYMVRKMIIDSLKFWVNEYHVDGFRFDLMGLYDIETMQSIREEMDKIDPDIVLYGEPWNGAESALSPERAAIKNNIIRLPEGIGAFSDDIRDAIKGDSFNTSITGYIHGNTNCRETVKMGITGACGHQGINLSYLTKFNYFQTNNPLQAINYVSSHDNYTLYDKLLSCEPNGDIERIKKLVKLSAAIIFTSQGIPFFNEGEEFLNTKFNDYNSYKSGDIINEIDWDRQKDFQDVVNYYKGLINLRKKHPAFRMTSSEDVRKNLGFIESDNNNIITYILSNNANGDTWSNIAVVINTSDQAEEVKLPFRGWNIVVDAYNSGVKAIRHVEGDIIKAESISVVVAAL